MNSVFMLGFGSLGRVLNYSWGMAGRELVICKISDLWKEEKATAHILTCSQNLDGILNGGISLQKVTEIFGDKGIGKTTLCYQLALDVQIPKELGGLDSQCIYIDTENSFSVKRVRTMAEKCAAQCRNMDPDTKLTRDSLLNGIHYFRCGTAQELQEFLENLQDYIMAHPKVKLVIIDSLAFLFYRGTQQFHQRGKILYEISEKFAQLTSQHKLGIVVTNNMTTRFSEGGTEYRIPFLGEIWTHIPNVRLHFEAESNTRVAKVVKGAVLPKQTTPFRVIAAGIRD